MAGWDQAFQIDPGDVEVFRSCMRVWRRTCARHYVEMTYQKSRDLRSGRLEYSISYNLRSINIGPAAGEFLVEMRAVSSVLQGPRQKALPLRLAREIARVNCWTIRQQADEGWTSSEFESLDGEDQERVLLVMEDFQAAFWSWRCSLVSPADFLEAQHSLVVELGLVFGSGLPASKFPKVVDGLACLPVELRRSLKKLGTARNGVKHRQRRHEAKSQAQSFLSDVLHTATTLTGMHADPVSAQVSGLLNDTADPLQPNMFLRSGQTRSVRR